MTEPSPQSEEGRRLLRGYLLDTLSTAERERVERSLAESEPWRQALERERNALAALDAWPDEAPSRDLTSAVMRRVEAAEQARTIVWGDPWLRRFVYATAAIVLLAGAAVVLPAFSRARESARRESAQNDLKQWGLILQMYANESPGQLLPPLAPYEGLWMVDVERLYPEYLTDLALLVPPGGPEVDARRREIDRLAQQEPIDWEAITRIAAKRLVYTGWAVTNDAEFRALNDQRTRLAQADFDRDLPGSEGTMYRLREGIERFFVTDINNPAATAQVRSRIPVMFENVHTTRWRRKPGGCNVLYLDGHVEFVRYGEAFPVTDAVAEILRPPED